MAVSVATSDGMLFMAAACIFCTPYSISKPNAQRSRAAKGLAASRCVSLMLGFAVLAALHASDSADFLLQVSVDMMANECDSAKSGIPDDVIRAELVAQE